MAESRGAGGEYAARGEGRVRALGISLVVGRTLIGQMSRGLCLVGRDVRHRALQ